MSSRFSRITENAYTITIDWSRGRGNILLASDGQMLSHSRHLSIVTTPVPVILARKKQ